MTLPKNFSMLTKYTHVKSNKYCQSVFKSLLKVFSIKKGAIFGFGEQVNDDTGSVLKISELDEKKIEDMNQSKVPVHNIGEERSEGFFNK